MGKLLTPLSYRLFFFFFFFLVVGYGENAYDCGQGQLLPFLAPMTFCVTGVEEGGGAFAQEEGWGQEVGGTWASMSANWTSLGQ